MKVKLGIRMEDNDQHQPQAPWLPRSKVKVARSRDLSESSWPNAVRVSLEAGGGIPCRPNPAATLLVTIVVICHEGQPQRNNELPRGTALCRVIEQKTLVCRPSVQPNITLRFSTGVRLLLITRFTTNLIHTQWNNQRTHTSTHRINLHVINIYKFHHCPSVLAPLGFKPTTSGLYPSDPNNSAIPPCSFGVCLVICIILDELKFLKIKKLHLSLWLLLSLPVADIYGPVGLPPWHYN